MNTHIKRVFKKVEIEYQKLGTGDWFLADDSVYYKLCLTTGLWIAIAIGTGQLGTFHPTTIVTRLDALVAVTFKEL